MHDSFSIGPDLYPGTLVKYIKEKDHVDLYTSHNVVLRISIITDNILRFRYSTESFFQPDFSYAINPEFVGGFSEFRCEDKSDVIIVKTKTIICKINKQTFNKTICDIQGTVLNEDEKGFHWEPHPSYGGEIVKMCKIVQEKEHFFGLGDKPSSMNMKGKRFKLWGSDVYGFKREQDPLYKNIPFYIGLHHDTAYGIFFDNTFSTHFDFGSERRSASSFWADGGEMNYYFIHGPEMLHVVSRYSHLTGVPELPPLWVLGYHQCKWSYFPESKVVEVAENFRKLKIPCDALYLDIDYMDGFRCFTWDLDKFPKPKKMVSNLKDQGFKTVVIIDPGIKVDDQYDIFNQAFERGYFCKRADGPYMKGKVWPGDCYFPDFTNPEVRTWWAGLFKELIEDIGVHGVWNDMNEPAVFETENKTFPDDVRHNYDGNFCSHRKAHNIYGMQMARASYEGVKKFAYPNRPFLITRSLFAGTQRFSSAWTGDNLATWEHLWLANVQCQRMCISGYSFIGSDVGGFIEQPTPELYVRWIQLATFHPFFRTHSSGDHGDQEPWSFGKASLDIVRKYIELRYQLLPYLYSTFYQYIHKRIPFLRPLYLYDQQDPDTHFRDDEFLCGDHILVAPVLEPNSRGRYLYLPKGTWFNYWSGVSLDGGEEIWEDLDLNKIPLYIRAGAVIPMYPIQQYVGEKEIELLTLHVYYSQEKVTSYLYEDSGDGYDYKRDQFNTIQFTVRSNHTFITLTQSINGNYKPSYDVYEIIIHGLPFTPTLTHLDNNPENIVIQKDGTKLILKTNREFGEIRLSVDS